MNTFFTKARSDSKLDSLTGQQKDQIVAWLTTENLSYARVVERVRAEFGVATSNRAVHAFYGRHVRPRQFARAMAEAADRTQGGAGVFEAATLRCAKQLAFSALANPEPNLRLAQAMMRLASDRERLALAVERVGLTKEMQGMVDPGGLWPAQTDEAGRKPAAPSGTAAPGASQPDSCS